MAKLGQDFTMWTGEVLELVYTVTNAAGAAVNITGCTVTWGLFASDTSAVSLISKSTTAGNIVLTTPASGIYTVSIAAADSAGLSGNYFCRTFVTNTSNVKICVAVGLVTINVGV